MSCFRGGSNSKSRDGYDKFVSEEDGKCSQGLPQVIQLKASRGERRKRKKCPSVQLDLVVKKLRGTCSKMVQIAKRSGSSQFMELFTNNQLLVHFSASSHAPRKRKLYPTVGFTSTNNNTDTPNDNSNNNSQLPVMSTC